VTTKVQAVKRSLVSLELERPTPKLITQATALVSSMTDRGQVRGHPSVRQVDPVGTGNGYQFTPCQRRARPRPAVWGRWPLSSASSSKHDDAPPIIHPERPIGGWGSFDLSAHVVKIIQVSRDFADHLDALFREVDPRFEDEVAKRAEDSILTAFERMAAHLPVDAKRAERNRARFHVLPGGK
jgi:hypothetical protein